MFLYLFVYLARLKRRWKGHEVKDILCKVDLGLRGFNDHNNNRAALRDSWDELKKATTVIATKENKNPAIHHNGKHFSAIKRMAFAGDRRSPSINICDCDETR